MFDFKKDFPVLKRSVNGRPLVYLDNAATTQKPWPVIRAVEKFYSHYNANVHRGIHALSEEASAAYDNSRQIIADFVGAEFQEIIFTRNATEAINLVARSWGDTFLRPGDEVVVSEMEHHSNLVPWQELAKRRGAKLKFIPVTAQGRLDLSNLDKIIGSKTKLVAVTAMSNALGTINPLSKMIKAAKKASAKVLIDAAQSIAHLPVNFKKLGADWLVFSGHKIYGPTGIGVLVGREAILNQMPPLLFGGDMIKTVEFSGATWNDLPYKFEAGTPHISGAIGLGAALEYLKKIGWRRIMAIEEKLTAFGLKELSKIKGFELAGPRSTTDRSCVFSFNIKGIPPHDLATILNDEGIAIRTGHHCAMPLMIKLGLPGTARASLSFYNTPADLLALVKGLEKAKKIFGA